MASRFDARQEGSRIRAPHPEAAAAFRACRRLRAPVSLETIKSSPSILSTPTRRAFSCAALWSVATVTAHAAETNVIPAPPSDAASSANANEPLLLALNIAAVICFVIWWVWMGRRNAMASAASDAPGDWEARARDAEARAQKATALLRARLMPQMARWMMGELVQRLMAHRSGLMSSQQRAEDDVAELEKRLEKLHAPLAERLAAYEKRISELEDELAAKGAENRELIEAKIDSARKKLQSERSKDPLKWN